MKSVIAREASADVDLIPEVDEASAVGLSYAIVVIGREGDGP